MTEWRGWSARRLWRWGLGSALAISVVLALLFGRATHRMQSVAASCTSTCHAPESHPTVWRTAGGHDGVPCQSCHEVAAKLVWTRLWRKKPVPHAKVEARACSSCHDASSDRGRSVMETAGHRAHGPEIQTVSCLSCHAKSTHAGTGAGESCGSCEWRIVHVLPQLCACKTCS
jgi:hypothetical protein